MRSPTLTAAAAICTVSKSRVNCTAAAAPNVPPLSIPSVMLQGRKHSRVNLAISSALPVRGGILPPITMSRR